MRKWNIALGKGMFSFDWTPGANFFRVRGSYPPPGIAPRIRNSKLRFQA